jgi:hypothetical protein
MPERQSLQYWAYGVVSSLVWQGLAGALTLYYRLLPRRSGSPTSCCALLHSFDGYKRFWPIALFFSDRALPPGLPVICASERMPMDPLGYRCLLTGSGSFVWRLLRALHRLRRSYRFVLYLQEDMWLPQPIPPSSLEAWLALMDRHQLQVLKLSAEAMPGEVPALLADQPSFEHSGSLRATWYGNQDFALSHHASLFDCDFLLRTLLFALVMGARQPKEHEIYVSRALRPLLASWDHPDRPVRIAGWQQQPLIEVVHASDGGELTPAAVALLQAHPDAPGVDETLPGEVFPARQSSSRGRHALG